MAEDKNKDKTAHAAGTGALIGGGVAAAKGGAGLAIFGTAVGLSFGAFILGGAIAGAGIYGIYRAVTKD